MNSLIRNNKAIAFIALLLIAVGCDSVTQTQQEQEEPSVDREEISDQYIVVLNHDQSFSKETSPGDRESRATVNKNIDRGAYHTSFKHRASAC